MSDQVSVFPKDEVLTLQEAANELKVSYSTIQAMTKSGELQAWRPRHNRRIVRIRRTDLMKVFSNAESARAN